MPGLLVTFLAQVLAASPEAPAHDLPAATTALAEARTAYAETLERSEFREDAPAMRELAEALAPLLIDVWRDHPTLQAEARELMQATAGEGLRPLIAQDDHVALALAVPWARWHDQAYPGAAAAEPARDRVQRALALYWPERGAAALADTVLRDAAALTVDGRCRTALLLPATERRVFLDRAITTLTARAPQDNEPACVRLALDHPAGRRWLQTALLDPRSTAVPPPGERWATLAAVLLAAAGPVEPRVGAQLARWTEYFRHRSDASARREMVTALDRQSPWWPDTPPARRAPVLALLRALGTEAVRLWPLRHALGDPTLSRDALAALSSPAVDPRTLAEAVRAVGLTTPPDARARDEAIEALDLLRSRLRPWGIDSVSPRELDRWRAALDDARPCTDEACAEALAAATDPMAARTVMLGVRWEDAAVARVVVRRVVTAGEDFVTRDGVATNPSALAMAMLTRPPLCPPALRGLVTVRPPTEGRFRSSWLDPWRERLIARCTSQARRP